VKICAVPAREQRARSKRCFQENTVKSETPKSGNGKGGLPDLPVRRTAPEISAQCGAADPDPFFMPS